MASTCIQIGSNNFSAELEARCANEEVSTHSAILEESEMQLHPQSTMTAHNESGQTQLQSGLYRPVL